MSSVALFLTLGDHDISSSDFQLRRCLFQQTLGILLRQAAVLHLVLQSHLRLMHDDGLESECGWRLTQPADISVCTLGLETDWLYAHFCDVVAKNVQ